MPPHLHCDFDYDCSKAELRHLPFDHFDYSLCSDHDTAMDLLAVCESGDVVKEQGLRHEQLIIALDRLKQLQSKPVLRVLFLNCRGESMDPGHSSCLALSPSTAKYLCADLGVPPAHLMAAASKTASLLSPGNCQWCSEDGGNKGIRGWYSYSTHLTEPVASVWFSYVQGCATYVVAGFDGNGVQNIIARYIEEGYARALLQPFAFDCMVAEVVSDLQNRKIKARRAVLVNYVRPLVMGTHYNLTVHSEAFDMNLGGTDMQELHMLSYTLISIGAQVADSLETLNFLLGAHKMLEEVTPGTLSRSSSSGCISVAQALSYLKSQANTRQRRVQSYVDRTANMINLLYHLSSQRTAEATGQTAVETQKDSSSMITIAALTMLFLPASFVSSLFGMGIFSFGQNAAETTVGEAGARSLTVSEWWWLYPATTLPLTLLVFGVWIFWRARRSQRYRNIEPDHEAGVCNVSKISQMMVRPKRFHASG